MTTAPTKKQTIKNSPLRISLLKIFEKKSEYLQACKEADKKASTGRVNNLPSKETTEAQYQMNEAYKEFQKEHYNLNP